MLTDDVIWQILDELTDQFGASDDFVFAQHAAHEADDTFVIRFASDSQNSSITFKHKIRDPVADVALKIEYGPRIVLHGYPIDGDPNDPLGNELPMAKPTGSPYIGGDPVTNPDSNQWGTLGLPAKAIMISNGRHTCAVDYSFLSNNHVIAMNDGAKIGSTISWVLSLNPFVRGESIGTLACFIPIASQPLTDAALANLTAPNVAWAQLQGLGKVSGVIRRPRTREKIYKAGARTGTSSGDFMGYANIYVGGRLYRGVGATSRRFGCAGDSGSVVVSGGSNPDLLGLYFAGEAVPCMQGGGPTGYFIPLHPDSAILDALRDQVIHWSEDGRKLGGGSALEYYAGSSIVRVMIPYTNGVLTAFARGSGDHVVHWSPDGKKLGGGSAVDYYAGSSAVTAMIPYMNGVLTAFARGPRDHVVHWSPDGKNLGGGSAVDYYAGSSAVTAMIPYMNGVLTAFARGRGDHVVHWSPDGKNLGGGSAVDYYAGSSAVTAMIPYMNGVLTAFARESGDHVVHWSPNGKNLGGGSPDDFYRGSSRVMAMCPYRNGVLTAFSN